MSRPTSKTPQPQRSGDPLPGGWRPGDSALAARDLTSSFGGPTVVMPAGEPLIVLGESGNALHPISVAARNRPGYLYLLAVSPHELERPSPDGLELAALRDQYQAMRARRHGILRDIEKLKRRLKSEAGE